VKDENKPDLKVVDFRERKKEKQAEEGDYKTKYDFHFDETDYLLKVDVYKDGILCTYAHHVSRQIGPMVMEGLCKPDEMFVRLSKWEKFLNFLGDDISVETKL